MKSLTKSQFTALLYADEGHLYRTNYSYHTPNGKSYTEQAHELINMGLAEDFLVPGTLCYKVRLTSAGRAVLADKGRKS